MLLVDVDGEGAEGLPTVSDGVPRACGTCVKGDVFVWPADSLLHTHNWRMGKLRARRRKLEPHRILRDTWTKLF